MLQDRWQQRDGRLLQGGRPLQGRSWLRDGRLLRDRRRLWNGRFVTGQKTAVKWKVAMGQDPVQARE